MSWISVPRRMEPPDSYQYQPTGPLEVSGQFSTMNPCMQGADAEALQSAIRPPSAFHVPLHLAQAQLSLQLRL
ncbi:hypothetical protein E4U22_007102 [Claviceps purpurea]|nr:hypothetical protein E4U22_007102 [Claviceps purpurea]